MTIQIDDILAALILSLFMYRRLEVLTTRPEVNPHVDPAKFKAWQALALSGYNLGAAACAAKVALNVAWFQMFKDGSRMVLAIGGVAIFIVWMLCLVWAWRRTTEANAVRAQLQIQRRPPHGDR